MVDAVVERCKLIPAPGPADLRGNTEGRVVRSLLGCLWKCRQLGAPMNTTDSLRTLSGSLKLTSSEAGLWSLSHTGKGPTSLMRVPEPRMRTDARASPVQPPSLPPSLPPAQHPKQAPPPLPRTPIDLTALDRLLYFQEPVLLLSGFVTEFFLVLT